eukprot:COSAG02_NODE_38055_length_434_cov_0.695522_1_plen_112_part_01
MLYQEWERRSASKVRATVSFKENAIVAAKIDHTLFRMQPYVCPRVALKDGISDIHAVFPATGNHYAALHGVGCADPGSGPIPRSQQYTIDAAKHRVSVDVRFNQSETGRDVG